MCDGIENMGYGRESERERERERKRERERVPVCVCWREKGESGQQIVKGIEKKI